MSLLGIKMKTCLAILTVLSVLLWAGAGAAATVPQAANAMGREMDRQLMERLGQGVSLSITTPVDVNNLEVSNALARQVQEEIARWFVQAGYTVHEIRKGANVLFEPRQGEIFLTRKQRLLAKKTINSNAVVGGTYTVTPKSVRFNMRVVAAGNREVLAMSTITVPMSQEVAALLKVSRQSATSGGGYGAILIEPTVVTLLP